MKISANNSSYTIQLNSNKKAALSKKSKESIDINVIHFNNKKAKTKNSDFLTSILTQKQEMQEKIDDKKLTDFKHLLKLEDEKSNAIKNIKDICKKNKDTLSQWNGISPDLDNILSGDVNSVLGNMSFSDVNGHINNLEIGVVFDDLSELKKYYDSGLYSHMNFSEYRQSKGENSTFNPKDLTGDKAGNYSLLESLKYAYKELFRIDDAIKNFKKDSKEQLDEMQKNMEKIFGGFKSNKNFYDDLVKNAESWTL